MGMEEGREKRYRGKIELIGLRINEIHQWKPGFFIEDKDRLAIYKAFQEIAEACMDLLAMMLKDSKKVPEDDYSNVNWAVNNGLIPKELKDMLFDLNGLRNRITHEYNNLDDRISYDSMFDMLPEIDRFVGVVKEWILR